MTRDREIDHDPDALDARAALLDVHARALADAGPRDRAGRGLVDDLRATAALLRRLADDLRVLDAFLRACDLLAPPVDDAALAAKNSRSGGVTP